MNSQRLLQLIGAFFGGAVLVGVATSTGFDMKTELDLLSIVSLGFNVVIVYVAHQVFRRETNRDDYSLSRLSASLEAIRVGAANLHKTATEKEVADWIRDEQYLRQEINFLELATKQWGRGEMETCRQIGGAWIAFRAAVTGTHDRNEESQRKELALLYRKFRSSVLKYELTLVMDTV